MQNENNEKTTVFCAGAAVPDGLSGEACHGWDSSDVSIVEWEHSDIYTDADIQAAMDTVMTYFETEFKGCTLTQLCYPGDASADLFTEWAEECEADEAIVLYSSFDTDASGGDGSLEPNTTYDDFQWILVRDNGGTWEVKTYGYG